MDNDAIAALKAAYEALNKDRWQQTLPNEVSAIDYPVALTTQPEYAAFIVAAHTHVPALLAENERLRSENTQLNEIVQQAMLHAAKQEVKQDEILQNLDTILKQLGIKPTDTP